jgi:cytoplasmic FMR1 interacting protein
MSVASNYTSERDRGTEIDVLKLLNNTDVLVKEINFIHKLNLEDDVADLQCSSASLNAEASTHNVWSDHQGYFTTFSAEIDFIAKMESLVDKGQALIHVLYTYRSVSQAIPEISMDLPPDATKEMQEESQAKRNEINRKVLDILRPEIVKVKDLIAFLLQASTVLHSCVTHLANKELNKETIPEGIYISIIKLMDVILILDQLKDLKTCLQKDFSRYKRVVGQHPSIEIIEELQQLQLFLSNPEPKKAKFNVFLNVRDEVKRVNGHENVFLDALELAFAGLEKKHFVTPEELFRLIRMMPYFMLLADGEGEDAKSFNIFKTSKIKLSNLQKIFKRYPVVPLYGDLTLTLEYVLRRSLHYDSVRMGSSWGAEAVAVSVAATSGPGSGDHHAGPLLQVPPMPAHYDLRSYWEPTREAYAQYVTRFSASLSRLLASYVSCVCAH